MAGVTDAPFRELCRRFGAGLYVSEMVTARALVADNAKACHRAAFAAGESPRSLQLYGTETKSLGEAVARLTGAGRADHIDLNFGCPVPKITRHGGGAALPWKRALLRRLVRAAVRNAGGVPVTVKFRIGIDDAHPTYFDVGQIAAEAGCAAVALHARTAAQLYDGAARWEAIAALKAELGDFPVLGNGDIWEARDALRMMRSTGCDGVVVGRGCLGRPWLFRDLSRVLAGLPAGAAPTARGLFSLMREHAGRLAAWSGERVGLRSFRKHGCWYTAGLPGGARLRARLMRVATLGELEDVLAAAIAAGNADLPIAQLSRTRRGKRSGTQRVALPPGWLLHRDDPAPHDPRWEIAAGELSGG